MTDGADEPARSSAPAQAAPTRRDVASIVVGAVAILGWGLFFDQLARVGRWIFDTTYALSLPTMADLHYRLRDAHNAFSRNNLYGFRHGAFTYPPITAYLYGPFRLIGLRATETVWTLANMVVLALFIALLLNRFCKVRLPVAWLAAAAGLAPATVFVFYPFRSLLLWGQLGLLLLFAIFLDVFYVPKRYRGLLIGAATAVKLLPGLFVIWFLAKKEIPAVLRVIGAFALLTLVAAAIWPHASAQYWFHILPSGKDVGMVSNPLNLPTTHGRWYFGVGKVVNQSLRGMLGRPPFVWTGTMPWAVLAVGTLGVGLAVMNKLLRQRRELLAFLVLSTVTIMISPVSWVHYWVFAALGPFVAITEWRRDRATSIAAIVLAVSVCADLEDDRLVGLYAVGNQFGRMGPAMVFVIRNLYVLGGLVFLAVTSWQAYRTRLPEVDLWRDPITDPTLSR